MGEHARVRGHEPVPIADCQLSVVDRLLAARKADDNFLSLFRSFYFLFFLPFLLLFCSPFLSLFLCRLIDTRALLARVTLRSGYPIFDLIIIFSFYDFVLSLSTSFSLSLSPFKFLHHLIEGEALKSV